MYYRQPFAGSYPITQEYGEYIQGVTVGSGHTGIDYGCPYGTPILASESGSAVYAGWDDTGYGNCVIIQHPDGNATLYAHLSMISVTVGQKVSSGQIIGYSGATGNATGPHLHFEMRDANNKALNPMYYLHSSIEQPIPEPKPALKGADQLGEKVKIVCPAGAKAWYDDFTKFDVFPQGTDLANTGKTVEHNGYIYCECYPQPRMYLVAVNDHDTQILDNAK